MDLLDSLVVALQWLCGGLLAYGGYLCVTQALLESFDSERAERSARTTSPPTETPRHAEEAHP